MLAVWGALAPPAFPLNTDISVASPGVWRGRGQVTPLTREDVLGAEVLLVMMDSRWDDEDDAHYWTLARRINEHYARQHGYKLLLFHMDAAECQAARQAPSGCKTLALYAIQTLYAESSPRRPLTVVYIDSDAFVRDQRLSVPDFLQQAGGIAPADPRPLLVVPACPCARPWRLRRDVWPWAWLRSRRYVVNGGIIIIRATPATATEVFEAVREWLFRAAAKTAFPYEQEVLKEMHLYGDLRGQTDIVAAIPAGRELWWFVGVGSCVVGGREEGYGWERKRA